MAQTKYYKVLTNDLNHNGYQYKLGLNILEEEFRTTDICHGLHFCKYENVIDWLSYTNNLEYICEVELCPDSKVVTDDNKLKTDKFILKNKRLISTFLKENGLELNAVKKDGIALYHIKDQDKDTCLTAVKQNGIALAFVKEQDKDICLAAVEQDARALQYVKDQDKDICLAAFRHNRFSLQYIEDKYRDICLAAIK